MIEIEVASEWEPLENHERSYQLNLGAYRGYIHETGTESEPGFNAALWMHNVELLRAQFSPECRAERFGVRGLVEFWIKNHNRMNTLKLKDSRK